MTKTDARAEVIADAVEVSANATVIRMIATKIAAISSAVTNARAGVIREQMRI